MMRTLQPRFPFGFSPCASVLGGASPQPSITQRRVNLKCQINVNGITYDLNADVHSMVEVDLTRTTPTAVFWRHAGQDTGFNQAPVHQPFSYWPGLETSLLTQRNRSASSSPAHSDCSVPDSVHQSGFEDYPPQCAVPPAASADPVVDAVQANQPTPDTHSAWQCFAAVVRRLLGSVFRSGRS
ncbi:hypothetical protein [Neptuniibacter marinus]|uniref:hypothetical protein n=1 Tax=Neptuniibacter marinus TaxID=1806670 RepID=UPI003B5A51F0